MKLSITVPLVILLIIASVADAQNRRKEGKSLEVNLSSKFCVYGEKKHAEGTVRKFSKYCTEMICEKAGNTLIWVFRRLKDCLCKFPSSYKPIKASKKSHLCVFNEVSGIRGKVLATFRDTCLVLVCKASKRKIIIAAQTIPKCVCQGFDPNVHHDPDSWSSHSYLCGGISQSPIDLISDITEDVVVSPLIFKNFEVPQYLFAKNDGYLATIYASLGPGLGEFPTISGGGLNQDFVFENIYFHWGSDSSQGSEHRINGKAYPLEMQIIFKNSMYLNPLCTNLPDGLAILAFLFRVSENDNPVFDIMISILRNAEDPAGGSGNPEMILSLTPYIEVNMSNYFRYSGSLTTTFCLEAVIWNVFKDPIPISENQLEAFRYSTKDRNGNFIKKNFRPVQPLNGRIIQHITM